MKTNENQSEEGQVFVSFRTDPEFAKRARARAKQQNRSMAGYLRNLIIEDLGGDSGGGGGGGFKEPDPPFPSSPSQKKPLAPTPGHRAAGPTVPTSYRTSKPRKTER